MAAHIDASIIQAGSSRHTPGRISTWTISLLPHPTRRINGSRRPCRGCHLYSMTTVPNRYVECRSLSPAITEDVEAAVERILAQALPHQDRQPVIGFAQIRRAGRQE